MTEEQTTSIQLRTALLDEGKLKDKLLKVQNQIQYFKCILKNIKKTEKDLLMNEDNIHEKNNEEITKR